MRKIKRFVKMFTFNFSSRFNIDGILKALISQESLFCCETHFPAQQGALLSTLPPPLPAVTSNGAAANLADPDHARIQVLGTRSDLLSLAVREGGKGKVGGKGQRMWRPGPELK